MLNACFHRCNLVTIAFSSRRNGVAIDDPVIEEVVGVAGASVQQTYGNANSGGGQRTGQFPISKDALLSSVNAEFPHEARFDPIWSTASSELRPKS